MTSLRSLKTLISRCFSFSSSKASYGYIWETRPLSAYFTFDMLIWLFLKSLSWNSALLFAGPVCKEPFSDVFWRPYILKFSICWLLFIWLAKLLLNLNLYIEECNDTFECVLIFEPFDAFEKDSSSL